MLISLPKHKKTYLSIHGTFRNIPRGFIHAVIAIVVDRASCLYQPVISVLAAPKTCQLYHHVFNHIVGATDYQVKPDLIVCDYKIALLKSTSAVFPGVEVVRHSFHWKQACRRHITKCLIDDRQAGIVMPSGVVDMLTVIKIEGIANKGIAWVRHTLRVRCADERLTYSANKWADVWPYIDRISLEY